MPADNVFLACRKGDLTRLKYLVEKKEVDFNVRDCWDSTPLYYACICGHKHVVEYLLQNGARCEANTFDGERCLYGALTNEIKKLLLDSKVMGSTSKRRDEFDEFCEKMLKASEFSDIKLFLGEHEFKLHRCILASRSKYFKTTLETKWKNKEIRTNAINPKVFNEFLQYLYTGRIQVDRELFDEMLRLADQVKCGNLAELLKDAQAEAEYFESTKNRVKISTLVIDSPQTRAMLTEDFEAAISQGIPETFGDPFYVLRSCAGELEGEESMLEPPPHFDLCFRVQSYLFYCNKVFLCTRSEYFDALLRDHFTERERDSSTPIPVFTLRNITPNVFACILRFVYTDAPFSLTQLEVIQVLEAADIYLLPGLKKHCGTFLCSLIAEDTVVELLTVSRLHDLTKLEDACAEFVAENITTMTTDEEFRSFVLTDAHEVTNRQETDTISIIDDVRYHITSKIASFSEVEEAQAKLKLIDDLLEELGLEA